MDKSIVFYAHLQLTVLNLYSTFKCSQLISSRKQNQGKYNEEVLYPIAKKIFLTALLYTVYFSNECLRLFGLCTICTKATSDIEKGILTRKR